MKGRNEYTHRTILTELVSEWWNQEKEIFNMSSTHFTSRLEKNNIWRLRADLQNTRATVRLTPHSVAKDWTVSPCNLRTSQEASLSSLFCSAQHWRFYLVKLVCCCCFLKKIKDEVHRCKSNKNMSRICVLKTIKHGCKESKRNYTDVNNRFRGCKTQNQ